MYWKFREHILSIIQLDEILLSTFFFNSMKIIMASMITRIPDPYPYKKYLIWMYLFLNNATSNFQICSRMVNLIFRLGRFIHYLFFATGFSEDLIFCFLSPHSTFCSFYWNHIHWGVVHRIWFVYFSELIFGIELLLDKNQHFFLLYNVDPFSWTKYSPVDTLK